MKRRQLMRYAQAGLLTAAGMGIASGWESYQAQGTDALSVQWLGHTCVLLTGGKQRVLVNPFRTVGCTTGYRQPKVNANLVMISSNLLDEGFVEVVPGNPKLLYEPGVFKFNNLQIQGINTDHDRLGGRRFGTNVAWAWSQAGIRILHLGGAAAPITLEQKILMGRPDVLFIPVGGGPKAYLPGEAKQAIQTLNPKVIIPTHYRTKAATKGACDLTSLDEFLTLMTGVSVQQVGKDTLSLRPSDLPKEGSVIRVLSYKF